MQHEVLNNGDGQKVRTPTVMSSISNINFTQLTGSVLQAWQAGHESNNLLQQRTDKKTLKTCNMFEQIPWSDELS